jgi:hypothetical protein
VTYQGKRNDGEEREHRTTPARYQDAEGRARDSKGHVLIIIPS